jgi:hypothetical protein
MPRASSLTRDRPRAERPRPDPRRALADPRVRTTPRDVVHYSLEYTRSTFRVFSCSIRAESCCTRRPTRLLDRVSIGVPMNGCVHAPFKIDPFRSNRYADPMKKDGDGGNSRR